MENDVEIVMMVVQVQFNTTDKTQDVVVLQSQAGNGGGSFKVPHDFCKVGQDITITIKHKSPIYRPGSA